MLVRKLVLFFACFSGLFSGLVYAQSEARIRVVIPSLDQVEDDLKWLIELSPTAGLKQQWVRLKEDILDAYTQGVNPKQPVCIDYVFRKDEMSMELRVPVVSLLGAKTGLIPNLKGMGYTQVVELTKGTFFQISEKNKPPFYLRFDKGYAWISTVKAAVPANPPLATLDLQPLLELNKDVIAELRNGADGIDTRRASFKELRKQFEALIKFRRNEDPNEFELRKLALTQQLDEAERFIVETALMHVNWTTETGQPNPHGRGEISIAALPGTELEKSIEEFATKSSHFANVVLHADPFAAGKLNFPLDSLRIRHLNEFYKTVRPSLITEINKRPGKTEPQKTGIKDATNLFLDMLDAGATLGVVDAFMDAHSVGPDQNVLVCGIRSANGKLADDIVKLLPVIQPECSVKSDMQEHGGVSIHEITIPKSRLASFQKVFAGETVIYVGTSKEAVWGAAGVGALKHLEDAIDQASQPAPENANPVVVNYRFQLAKLLPLIEIIQKEVPRPEAGKADASKGKEEAQRQKDLEKQQKEVERIRKLGEEAMAGCEGILQGELRRNGNKIEGFLEFNECALKYIGSLIADGVKKSLQ